MSGSHSIELAVEPAAVWEHLVAPGLRDWYYRLTPQGEFVRGAQIRWIDVRGDLVEESEVVEVAAPDRLVLRTRFLFAPPFAAAPPHLVTWEVTDGNAGSVVRMSWDAQEPVHRLLESEGGAMLEGLRLAADPAARAELHRLDVIGQVQIRDVTAELVPEYQHFFDRVAFRDFPAWQSCYCMETHRTQSDEEWAVRTAADNRRDMSELIGHGKVTALMAFAGGGPVGWCNYGETTRLAGVMSRYKLDAAGYRGIGALGCFVIAAPYRGHGVASSLLDGAVERLRARGLRAVEAYPLKEGDASAQSNYRGPMEMYLRAGFERIGEREHHVVMRKRLA